MPHPEGSRMCPTCHRLVLDPDNWVDGICGPCSRLETRASQKAARLKEVKEPPVHEAKKRK